jgi:hypothetical protein
MSQAFASDPVRTLCRVSLCALAISVSLGVALVSLSKALLVLAFVALLVQGAMNAAVNKPYNPSSVGSHSLCCGAMHPLTFGSQHS